jgi:hypothetical protein
MKVVLDTTAFENGFNSRSADVEVLRAFLERSGSELCVPKVVLGEVVNRVRKKLKEVNDKLNDLQRLTGDEQRFRKFEVESILPACESDLGSLLRDDLKGRILEYPGVGHEELVGRDLHSIKPFAASGKGYRDALIWFSIVELLQVGNESVVFITGNSNDWWESTKECRLHPQLRAELEDRSIGTDRLILLPSLSDFNERYAIADLPPDASAMVETPIDYLQVLVDRKGLVESMMQAALPKVLRAAIGAWVGDLEVVAISAPDEIAPIPIRSLDKEQRLLQFSTLYRVAAEFLIKKTDFPVWSRSFSFHMRRDWEENILKVQATIRLRALFRMITHGQGVETFSLASLMATIWDDSPVLQR